MSKFRHRLRRERFGIRTLALTYSSGTVLDAHVHDWHQLVYASEGVMSVETENGTWVVPPQRAVWVPAKTKHSITMSGAVSMRTLYLDPALSRRWLRFAAVVNVSPFLREAILHVVGIGMLDRKKPAHDRLIGVLLDELHGISVAPMKLPLPRDPRALFVARRFMDNPAGTVAERIRRSGASVRTIERLFRSETGMSLGRWRQQLRLMEALRLLAAGTPVTSIALDVGYESPSAFIAVFKQTFGTTPGRYFRGGESERNYG